MLGFAFYKGFNVHTFYRKQSNGQKTMKKIIFFSFLILAIGKESFSQNHLKDEPNWINYQQRNINYPKTNYLVSFISEAVNPNETLDEATDRISNELKGQLAEGIQVEIKTVTKLDVVIENTEVYNLINKSNVSVSEIKIAGLNQEFYHDKRQKMYYAFAYAEKNAVLESYSKSIEIKLLEIDANLHKANKYKEDNDKKNVLKSYFANLPLFREAEKDLAIITALDGNYTKLANAINDKKSENEQQTAQLIKSESNSINDVAFFMATSLSFQLNDKTQPIEIENFTFANTHAASEFSRLFKKIFSLKLAGLGYNVITNSSIAKIKISGTYWENDPMLDIVCSAEDKLTTSIVGSSENSLKKTYLDLNNIAYKALNIKNVISLQDSLETNTELSEGIVINFMTNKGKNNLIFEEGDTMKLYMKANKACFVRFIYYLADGNKVLLLDNYRINAEDVGKLIKIEQEFECYPPFGTEILQLNAQTTPFDELNTQNLDGYKVILSNISEIMSNLRGFKTINNEDGKAQKSIVITTLPKD